VIAGSGREDSGPVGRTLGHYRIVGEVGRGGMGVVYRAEDLHLGRQVALKALPPEMAGHPDRLARFRREARSLAALNHPNIVTLYAVEEIEGELFLAMELVTGQTLGEVIPAEGLELAKFFGLAIPLVDALGAAHEEGLVHRDLKPKNVLVTPQGRVKVLDFGLAKLRAAPVDPEAVTSLPTEGQTAFGAVVGTPAYMAPEQIRSGLADERSDIFALGLLLYQMVAGRHPFHGTSSADVVSAILRDEPPPLLPLKPQLPEHLERILRSCLEKDPEQRLQSAKDLRNQLASLQTELASGVLSQRSLRSLPARPVRRRPLVAALAVALPLALLAALWAINRGSPPAGPPLPHLAVTEARLLPGKVGPEYFRSGLIAALADRLAGLDGVWIVPPGSDPLPDLVVEADVRRVEETLSLRFQIQERKSRRKLGSEILEGSTREPFELLDRAGAALAELLDDRPGLSVRYQPGPAPSRDPAAFDLFLRARAAPDPGAALALLRRAVEKDPSFAPARALEGEMHRRRYLETRRPSRLDAAGAACREAAELDDELAAAHLCLARVSRARGGSVDAQREYVRAIELDPAALDAYRELRQVFLEQGVTEQAERTWKQVVALRPRYWAGYWFLGSFYLDSERYDDAIEQYQQALALAPDNAEAYLTLGSAYGWRGRHEEAIEAYQRSLAIRPNPGAYSNLGSLYLNLGSFPEAIASFERAVEFPEANETAFGNLARAYLFTPDRREDAAAAFEREMARCRTRLAEDPERAGAWFWLAYSLTVLGHREESLAALKEALDRRPNDPHYVYLAAWVYNRLGEREKALDALERAIGGGYPRAEARFDVEFKNLKGEPRFERLLGGG
jgi:eukaryotic-like serine/threonine-protein kinase